MTRKSQPEDRAQKTGKMQRQALFWVIIYFPVISVARSPPSSVDFGCRDGQANSSDTACGCKKLKRLVVVGVERWVGAGFEPRVSFW